MRNKELLQLKRHDGNPIISPKDMPVPCSAVFNTGATRFEGKVLLLMRVENFERVSNFHVGLSDDGVNFDINPEPINYPLRDIEKRYGSHRFDMRITELEGEYYVCHALWLNAGSCIAMAKTKDFVNFEPLPSVSVPSNRNAVLFPEKVNGLYARLERPQNTQGIGDMWISYSPDMTFWGLHEPIRMPEFPITSWASHKTGAGVPPIKTSEGWLKIYHGTTLTCSTENYYLGVALLDLNDPAKVLAAPRSYILGADEVYECVGQTNNAVFAGGAVEMEDGTLNVYYGAADSRICLARSSVKELLEYCLDNKED